MSSLKRFITNSTQPSSSIRKPNQKSAWLSAKNVTLLAMLLAIAGILLCSSAVTHVHAKTAQTADAKDASAIDPDAVDAVKKMSAYLRTLKSFQITDNVTQDDVLENGLRSSARSSISRRPAVQPKSLMDWLTRTATEPCTSRNCQGVLRPTSSSMRL